MFKKAKQRIVLSILAILGTVLVMTLGMIFAANYWTTLSQNYQVLERQMENLTEGQNVGPNAGQNVGQDAGQNAGPDRQSGGILGMRPARIARQMEVGTFYELKIPEGGTAEVVRNGADGLYTNEELIAYAEEVASGTRGKVDDLLYLVTQRDGVTYVCFMDNTVFTDSITRLFLYTLLFGVIAMIAITFISIGIANRIVAPMEESYQRQKQFTADAGHELKTPVAVVEANLELLRREVGENRWLENISYENNRMRDLITQLLDLARNENQEMEREITDLSHLVNGAILPYEAAAYERNILIEEDIAEGITANVNAKSIEQLVSILLDNAISHTSCVEGEFGKVIVRLSEARGAVTFSVSNPGEAIPESEREKLFERFYRSDRSREFTGHYGLGLAIARSIADANHGKISVACADGLVTFRVVLQKSHGDVSR